MGNLPLYPKYIRNGIVLIILFQNLDDEILYMPGAHLF
jgi:hypothetical protein